MFGSSSNYQKEKRQLERNGYFANKLDEDGKAMRNKAKLVAKGYL